MIKEIKKNGLLFYTSDILAIPHAMFSRHGGRSPAPFSSLNCSHYVGDDPSAVEENRKRMRETIGAGAIRGTTQVHGDSILVVNDVEHVTKTEKADAMITDVVGIGLLIQQADCQAVLLHDPVKNVIAAVHCGWRGSVQNIIAKTLLCMEREFGVRPSDILAVISPSLGPCCGEFINYRTELPLDFLPFQTTGNHFDFQAISRRQLINTGVKGKNIDTVRKCTVCNEDFFSYRRAVRRADGRTGRNGSVIALPVP
ncbi:MAG TPA: peptidoglycan editing factor PgeF [Desulfobulbus sp.]|nr:peptidoglycan editing factor PgeF [Desulfobulbus sp.]